MYNDESRQNWVRFYLGLLILSRVLPSPEIDVKALFCGVGKFCERSWFKFSVIKLLLCIHLDVENYFSLPKKEEKLHFKKVGGI